jgi:hypothetical protein
MRRRAHDGGGGRRTAEPRPFHHSLFDEWSPSPTNRGGDSGYGFVAAPPALAAASLLQAFRPPPVTSRPRAA